MSDNEKRDKEENSILEEEFDVITAKKKQVDLINSQIKVCNELSRHIHPRR